MNCVHFSIVYAYQLFNAGSTRCRMFCGRDSRFWPRFSDGVHTSEDRSVGFGSGQCADDVHVLLDTTIIPVSYKSDKSDQ